MRTSRRQFLELLGAGAGAAAAARLDAPPVFAQAAGPVKIGVLAIRAGIAAPVGTAGLRGTEWWAQRGNMAAGIFRRPLQSLLGGETEPKGTRQRQRQTPFENQIVVATG